MRHRRLGHTGLIVSEAALGSMQFGGKMNMGDLRQEVTTRLVKVAIAVMLQERLGLERYVTAQMYYSLVGRSLEYEFQSFAEYHDIGILVWSPLAGGFLSGKYSRDNPPPAGSRFADAGQFVPFDKEMGYRVLDAVKEVAPRHGPSPAPPPTPWLLARHAVCSVIIAARKAEQLEDNIRAVD